MQFRRSIAVLRGLDFGFGQSISVVKMPPVTYGAIPMHINLSSLNLEIGDKMHPAHFDLSHLLPF